MKLSAADLQRALRLKSSGGADFHTFSPEMAFTGISTDSRQTKKGDLFFALVGERFDGHDFIDQAVAKGAAGAVVSRLTSVKTMPVFKVKDTLEALGDLAAFYRAQLGFRCAAVTGSNGKTTTKEFLGACLATRFKTLRTQGNFNNLIGLPLTLFDLDDSHEAGVFELGMSLPGEIARLARICRPELAAFTNIAPVHLQTMGSIDAVAVAKYELIEAMPADGVAVLNIDDDYLRGWQKSIPCRVITYGIDRDADYRAEKVDVSGAGRARFVLNGVNFEIQFPGKHNIYNAACAVASACSFGCVLEDLAKPLASLKPYRQRSEILQTGGITIINDCYNANPVSMRVAIETLTSYPGQGRRIAVLGDMLELGQDKVAFHVEIGEFLEKAGVGALFAFGKLALHYLANYHTGHKAHFDDKRELSSALQKYVRPDDIVLVKGSRGMALEEITDFMVNER